MEGSESEERKLRQNDEKSIERGTNYTTYSYDSLALSNLHLQKRSNKQSNNTYKILDETNPNR